MADELSEVEREAKERAIELLPGAEAEGIAYGEAVWNAARDYYGAEQLRLERDREAAVGMAVEVELLQCIAQLREALEWYADDGNYVASGYLGSPEVEKDKGHRAEIVLTASPQSDHGPGITTAQAETAAYLTAIVGMPARDGVVSCKRGDQEFFLRPDGTLESGLACLAPGEFDGLPHQVGRSDHGPGGAIDVDLARLHNALLEINSDWSDWGEGEALATVLKIAKKALIGRPRYPLCAPGVREGRNA